MNSYFYLEKQKDFVILQNITYVSHRDTLSEHLINVYPHKIFHMKKIFLSLTMIFVAFTVYAQKIDMKTLEKNANLGSESYSNRALSLARTYKPNDKGELEISEIIPMEGKKQQDMYKNIQNWIISISSDAKSSIVYENKEEAKIVTRCYFGNIARRTMGDNKYWVSIRPMITLEFKDNKLRLTYIVQNYEILKRNDDSGYGFIGGGGFIFTGDGITDSNQNWAMGDCYPYVRSSKYPKVTASKGFVHSIECYKIFKRQIIQEAGKAIKKDNNW